MMGTDRLARETLELVEGWIPSEQYDHERKFQAELQEYLDRELNRNRREPITVSTEHGRSYADVAVADRISIELKRDLSNSQTKKLDGQINAHRSNYNYVIVCACGIDDMDGWRRVQQVYASDGFEAFDPDRAPVAFIHKRRETFGDGGGNGDGADRDKSRAATQTSTSSGGQSLEEIEREVAEDVDIGEVVAEGAKGVEALAGEREDMDSGDAIAAVGQLVIFIVLLLAMAWILFTTL